MGMYSSFIEQDIKVLNKNETLKIREELKDDLYDLIDNEGEIEFGNWSDMKIEGYWYLGTLRVLTTIAQFIEGYVEFSYEEGYNFRIEFENGKVYFKRQQQIEWDKLERQELKFEAENDE